MFLVGTPPVGDPVEFEKMFLPSSAGALITKSDLSDKELETWVTESMFSAAESTLQVANDIKNTDRQFRDFFGQSLVSGKYKNEVAIIAGTNISIAVAHGESDRLVNGEYFIGIPFQNLWQQQIKIIKQCGHYPQIEQPERFNKLLVEYLNQF